MYFLAFPCLLLHCIAKTQADNTQKIQDSLDVFCASFCLYWLSLYCSTSVQAVKNNSSSLQSLHVWKGCRANLRSPCNFFVGMHTAVYQFLKIISTLVIVLSALSPCKKVMAAC